jgi:hypothetical protein
MHLDQFGDHLDGEEAALAGLVIAAGTLAGKIALDLFRKAQLKAEHAAEGSRSNSFSQDEGEAPMGPRGLMRGHW